MRIFELGLHREARIWEGIFPDASFSSPVTLSDSVRAKPLRSVLISKEDSFCIEYKVDLGGRIGYGLLGATLTPASSDRLNINVSVKDPTWRSFSTPLYRVDTVFIGLPESLGRCVLNASLEYFIDRRSPTGGDLSFVAAAFSEVGSSPQIFERLAAACCHYLMTMVNHDPIRDDSEFAEIFSLLTNGVGVPRHPES